MAEKKGRKLWVPSCDGHLGRPKACPHTASLAAPCWRRRMWPASTARRSIWRLWIWARLPQRTNFFAANALTVRCILATLAAAAHRLLVLSALDTRCCQGRCRAASLPLAFLFAFLSGALMNRPRPLCSAGRRARASVSPCDFVAAFWHNAKSN